MKRLNYILPAFFLLIFITGCISISPPKIQITGEKTIIERQIVGDYKELEKDAWIISSIKTPIQKSKGVKSIDIEDIELSRAMGVREFHKDKIRKFKNEGIIGENNTGFIVYRKKSKYEKNEIKKNILLRIIKNENAARKTIFIKALMKVKKGTPTEKEIKSFGMRFAEEQSTLALKNDIIQDKSGRWIKK